jgi:SAM-dependent methyltransferase
MVNSYLMTNTNHQSEAHVARAILSAKGWEQYKQGDVSHDELAPYVAAIRELSRAYVSHSPGATLADPVNTEFMAKAYALYYLPLNAAKVARLIPLVELPQGRMRVLDFGSGPGTVGLALLEQIDPARIELTCVDASSSMRRLAHALLSRAPCGGELADFTVTADLPGGGQYDLIVAANVFAELGEGAADEQLTKLLQLLADGGWMLLVEPGQQRHTRRLMALRDTILQRHPAMVPIFPCHRADPCPMAQRSPEDWCHGTIEWQQPPLFRQLDTLAGFNKHRIKFAAFLFQRGGQRRPGYSVVAPPRKGARGIEATVCGEAYYGVVRIGRVRRGAGTKALEKAHVFDTLQFTEPPQEELTTTTSTHLLHRL